MTIITSCNGNKFHGNKSAHGNATKQPDAAAPEAHSADIQESNSSIVETYVEPEDITGTYLTCVSDSAKAEIACDLNMNESETSSFATDIDRVEVEYTDSVEEAEFRVDESGRSLIVEREDDAEEEEEEEEEEEDLRSMNIYFKPNSKTWREAFLGIEINRRRSQSISLADIDFQTKAHISIVSKGLLGISHDLKFAEWKHKGDVHSKVKRDGDHFSLSNGNIGSSALNYSKWEDFCKKADEPLDMLNKTIFSNVPHQIKLEFDHEVWRSFSCEKTQEDCHVSFQWSANIAPQGDKFVGTPMRWRLIRQSDNSIRFQDEMVAQSVILTDSQLNKRSITLQVMPDVKKVFIDSMDATRSTPSFNFGQSIEMNRDEFCQSDVQVEAHNLQAEFKAIKIRRQKSK